MNSNPYWFGYVMGWLGWGMFFVFGIFMFFWSKKVWKNRASVRKPTTEYDILEYLGFSLIIIGIAVAVYFFALFDTTVEVSNIDFLGRVIPSGRINNMGLMNDRLIGIVTSLFISIMGILVMIFANLNKKKIS